MSINNEQLTNTTAKIFLEHAFSALFDLEQDPRVVATKYMTADYIQIVDGKTLDLDGFVNHLALLRSTIQSVKFTFEEVIVSGNIIADIHIVEATKKDGSSLKAKLLAFFYLEGKKIKKIDELTGLLEGVESDRDLGSRV